MGESKESKFLETIKDCFFYQHIDKPTRRRGNDEPSQLDLIFSDEEMQVTNIHHLAPLGKSDHSVIIFDFCCYIDYSKPQETFHYAKGDYEGMRQELQYSDWCTKFIAEIKNKTVEENWHLLKSKLIGLRDKYVPLQKALTKPNWKGAIPISKDS